MHKKLMTIFIASLLLNAMIIIIYETNILLEGGLCGDANSEFLASTAMQLITIGEIPLALRMFKFNGVRAYITANGIQGHYRMALIRMMMLMVPLTINVLCYYLFMKASFAYLAVIIAISLIFIIPTQSRCDSEL